MSSAISCIVIKSDRLPKRVPQPGELVKIHGQAGFFTVMSVDKVRRMAHVMEHCGQHRLTDVPFVDIRTFNRSLARTIQRFLDARESVRHKS